MKKFLMGLGLSALAVHASATYTVFFTESGSNVVATGAGSIDTTGMSFIQGSICGEGIGGTDARTTTCMGAGVAGNIAPGAILNPVPIGPANVVTLATAGSGDPVFLVGTSLYLPTGYVSGAQLSSSNTYAGKTLAALGVTAGTYTYNLSSGDKIVVNIGIAELVFPEPASTPVAKVGVAYSLPLSATGGSGEISYQLGSGTLPPGVTLNPTSGLISGTPIEAGFYSVSVLAKDSADQQKSVTLYIVVDPLDLAIQSTTLPVGKVGVAYNADIVVTGGVAPYSFTVEGALPEGLTLNPETGAITGTPTKAQTSNFSVTISDSYAVPTAVAANQIKAVSTLTQSFSITIAAEAVVPPAATPVPTLGAWGMLSLSALLMGVFGVAQRRKRNL